jgi:hypothetical protein
VRVDPAGGGGGLNYNGQLQLAIRFVCGVFIISETFN